MKHILNTNLSLVDYDAFANIKLRPGACFSKALETFQAHKAIFS